MYYIHKVMYVLLLPNSLIYTNQFYLTINLLWMFVNSAAMNTSLQCLYGILT